MLWVLTLSACNGREDASQPPARQASAATAKDPATIAAESVAAARDQWNKAEVARRLTEAGLVVADSGRSARHAPLSIDGDVLHVSGSELVLFVYGSADERLNDAATLDTTSTPGTRLIVVNNLIALHRTMRERLAERVHDVLTARHIGAPAR
jgi:hypothetical protein